MDTTSSENAPRNMAENINTALFEISGALNTIHDPQKLFAFVHETINRIIPLPNFFIALYEEKKRSLHFPYFEDEYDTAGTVNEDCESSSSLTGEVLKSERAFFLKEHMLAEWARNNRVWGTVPKIWIGVPLMIRGKAKGVVCIQHYTDPNYFSQIHLELLNCIAPLISAALDKKLLSDELERERDIFSFIRSNSKSLIAVFDQEGIYTSANPAHDQLGYSPLDLIGTSLFNILHQDDVPDIQTFIKNNAGDNPSFSRIFKFKDKDEHPRYLEGILKLMQDFDGGLDAMLLVGNIVSLQKTSEGIQTVDDPSPLLKTILIVEDEEAIRTTLAKALNSFGYKTIQAADGKNALDIYKSRYREIDAVLLDVILPKISGAKVFKNIIEINPEAKIIITSGHITPQDKEEMFSKACAFIEKPFRFAGVKNMLEDMLF